MHPFIKWAGGKTQLLGKLLEFMPKEFNTYYEPFVGGGALLFKVAPKKFVINDLNKELVQAYLSLGSSESSEKIQELLKQHEQNNSEEYFYKVRDMDKSPDFNKLTREEIAARMIYLNKSCFNGLYRVNSKGFFNVPYGKKKTVKCFEEENLKEILDYFAMYEHEVLNTDFEDAVKNTSEGDFVYFDPPYDTWDDKDSFTSYSKNGFGKDEQIRLANVCKELDKKGVMFMLSNHNTQFIRDLYKDFNIHVVPAKRMINSNASGRGNVEEVIINNYGV